MSTVLGQRKTNPRDWSGPEHDYRAGVLTLREIGALYGVTHTAVNKRAKAYGWTRDLAARVRLRADETLAAHDLATASENRFPDSVSRETAASADSAVEQNAAVVARIRVKHKARIAEACRLYDMLVADLEARIGSRGQGESVDAADLAELVDQIAMLRDLTACMAKIVICERKAYRLDQDSVDDRISRLSLPIRFVGTVPAPSETACPAPAQKTCH